MHGVPVLARARPCRRRNRRTPGADASYRSSRAECEVRGSYSWRLRGRNAHSTSRAHAGRARGLRGGACLASRIVILLALTGPFLQGSCQRLRPISSRRTPRSAPPPEYQRKGCWAHRRRRASSCILGDLASTDVCFTSPSLRADALRLRWTTTTVRILRCHDMPVA
jgi:hypothetical protein